MNKGGDIGDLTLIYQFSMFLLLQHLSSIRELTKIIFLSCHVGSPFPCLFFFSFFFVMTIFRKKVKGNQIRTYEN